MQYRRQNTEDKKQKTKFFLGFTLIELLVVISILGILAGFGISRYILAEKQARDSERKSDLTQYRIALENYAAANDSVYPVACGNVTGLCSLDDFATEYLSGACLNDPRASVTTYYYYCSDSLKYALWATLESGGYYEVCSNGRSGKLTEEPVATDGECSLSEVAPTAIPTTP